MRRCCVTLPIAFLLFPLAFVLVFHSNGDGPVSSLDEVLLGWLIMFIIQFWLIFLWPIPLLIGLLAAVTWQWQARRKQNESACNVAASASPENAIQPEAP